MLKKSITIILITSLFLYTACASNIPGIRLHQVKDYEYIDIKGAGKVFVTTVDNFKYEVSQLEFTDTHLIGIQLQPDGNTKPVELPLNLIRSIGVKGYRDKYGKIFTEHEIKMNMITERRYKKAFTNALGSSVFSGLLIIFAHKNKTISLQARSVIIGGLSGVILLGGYIGYKKGKKEDIEIAIKKIKRKKELEK